MMSLPGKYVIDLLVLGFSAPVLFLLGLVATSPVSADVDREKKDAEDLEVEPRPELDDGAGLDGGNGARGHASESDILAEGKKNLEDIRRLLDEVQDQLSKRDTGSSTQGKQGEAVQKMSKLIEDLLEAAQQGGQGGSGSDQNSSQKPGSKSGSSKGQQQGKGQNPQDKQGKARGSQQQVSGGRPEGSGSGEEPQGSEEKPGSEPQGSGEGDPRPDGSKERNDRDVGNDRVADGAVDPTGAGKTIAELKKSRQWGLLPPKIRDEMISASSKEPPREYREVIERYYKRISDHYSKKRR
jgi:hypothetical protein